jgi:uncharacterized protein (TIGR02598 family)
MKTSVAKNAAFSLVEVTLALGVAGFCLLAILGLLPAGLKTNEAAVEQTAATGILSAVSTDLRATPGWQAVSEQFAIAIPPNPVSGSQPATLYFSEDGKLKTSPADARYRLTVACLDNGQNEKAPTLLSLRVSWPAVVDPSQASGSAQTFVALDRN